jgi:starvation-inducible DNA-binding protein
MQHILDSFRTMISLQREIAGAAGEAGDEGTSDLMSDYIREQEKQVWMYSAYLK